MITDGTHTYTYDGLNRVMSAGTATGFAYSGVSNALAADGSATYSRDPSANLIGVSQAGVKTLAYTDRHGDVVGQFKGAGTALTSSTAYEPLGAVIASTSQTGLGFQSGWTDKTTGKVNMASRWYDPATGQFASQDTYANSPNPLSANANPYGYGDANPLNGTDSTGHNDEPLGGGGGGGGVMDIGGAPDGGGSVDVVEPGAIADDFTLWELEITTGQTIANQAEEYLKQIDAQKEPAGPVTESELDSDMNDLHVPDEASQALSNLQYDLWALRTYISDPEALNGDACYGGCGHHYHAPPTATTPDEPDKPKFHLPSGDLPAAPPPPPTPAQYAQVPAAHAKPPKLGHGSGIDYSPTIIAQIVTALVVQVTPETDAYHPHDAADASAQARSVGQ